MRIPASRAIAFSALVMFLALGCGNAVAKFKELATPPEVIRSYSEQQLNELGRRMAEEAYAVFAEVGSPTGEISRKALAADDPAVMRAKSIVAERALIQTARLNHGLTKETYMPSDIDEFTIEDVVLTQPAEGVLVVSYRVALPNRSDTVTGTVMKGEAMPRLTVLNWNDELKMWQVFSHADFDTPLAAICGRHEDTTHAQSRFDLQDIELGTEVIDGFVKAMLADTLREHVLKGYQYVYASGERKTKDGPVRTHIKKNVERSNLEAVRSGRLLAIRYDTPGVLTLDDGEVEPDVKPRLFTFYRDGDGKWRFIAAAVFSVTQTVAKGTDCIAPTVE